MDGPALPVDAPARPRLHVALHLDVGPVRPADGNEDLEAGLLARPDLLLPLLVAAVLVFNLKWKIMKLPIGIAER